MKEAGHTILYIDVGGANVGGGRAICLGVEGGDQLLLVQSMSVLENKRGRGEKGVFG